MIKIITKQGDHKAKVQKMPEVDDFATICEDLKNGFYNKMARACGMVSTDIIKQNDTYFECVFRPALIFCNALTLKIEKC